MTDDELINVLNIASEDQRSKDNIPLMLLLKLAAERIQELKMPLKGVTLAEKLRLAQEAGLTLPHYTNTDSPVDFPKSEIKSMNHRFREFERSSGLEIYGLGLDRVKWEAALEKFAELIVRECAEVGAYHGGNVRYLILNNFGLKQ